MDFLQRSHQLRIGYCEGLPELLKGWNSLSIVHFLGCKVQTALVPTIIFWVPPWYRALQRLREFDSETCQDPRRLKDVGRFLALEAVLVPPKRRRHVGRGSRRTQSARLA